MQCSSVIPVLYHPAFRRFECQVADMDYSRKASIWMLRTRQIIMKFFHTRIYFTASYVVLYVNKILATMWQCLITYVEEFTKRETRKASNLQRVLQCCQLSARKQSDEAEEDESVLKATEKYVVIGTISEYRAIYEKPEPVKNKSCLRLTVLLATSAHFNMSSNERLRISKNIQQVSITVSIDLTQLPMNEDI